MCEGSTDNSNISIDLSSKENARRKSTAHLKTTFQDEGGCLRVSLWFYFTGREKTLEIHVRTPTAYLDTEKIKFLKLFKF